MIEKKVYFYSEGYKLDGTVYLPEDLKEGEKRPAIIPNSGYNGFNGFYPKMFARQLTDAGYICLGFDYRSFGVSEGENGRVLLTEQVEDINNAITFLQLQENVDSNCIGLIGWGMGASNVIQVAAKNKQVSAVAVLNGFYIGERWLKSIHSYKEWRDILETVNKDRIRRVTKGESLLTEPFIHYPLDPATKSYVLDELAPIKGFGKQTRLQFTESIIEMNAEKVVTDIAPVPLFIAHGIDNLLHPYDEALALYKAAKEPKELYTIEGKHNDFMFSNHKEFKKLVDELLSFFKNSLKEAVKNI